MNRLVVTGRRETRHLQNVARAVARDVHDRRVRCELLEKRRDNLQFCGLMVGGEALQIFQLFLNPQGIEAAETFQAVS